VREKRGVYTVLVGKPEGKRPLGRPRRRLGDNIKMDVQEMGCGSMDWIELAQDRNRWRALVSFSRTPVHGVSKFHSADPTFKKYLTGSRASH